ncbi:sulfotransferase [Roseiconus lacunae]|uniref:Sulfotransferase n=1 Tax=Roseiconus lacunae TaxID=2605694 RepID=A0ABT7PPN6_9BACT|nr:sulfotransferase [Roseiconus lacunae]MDM4018463.1 sulfotransferase [Roseiconus lacunae]
MGFKLTIGRLRDAWSKYPQVRRQLYQFPPGKPIFIAGTHRSGTTWFAQMLAEPGLWYVHEPFNPNKGYWSEEFTSLAFDQRNQNVDAYFRRLLSGQHRDTSANTDTDHPLMPLRLFRQPIRRMMIKDPLACLMTGYFAANFDVCPLVLFRHPAGFVSSILRLRWPIGKFLQDFASRESLLVEHLSPYRGLLVKHQHDDNAAAATVLHGVLNTVMWNQIQKDAKIAYHFFEDLCANPLERFREIFDAISLPYSDATRQRHETLCNQGPKDPRSYRTHAVARNSLAMANSWRSQLAPSTVDRIRDVWNQFDLPFYRSDEHWDVRSAALEACVD